MEELNSPTAVDSEIRTKYPNDETEDGPMNLNLLGSLFERLLLNPKIVGLKPRMACWGVALTCRRQA